jgi:hypothetical protein
VTEGDILAVCGMKFAGNRKCRLYVEIEKERRKYEDSWLKFWRGNAGVEISTRGGRDGQQSTATVLQTATRHVERE